MGLIFHSLTSLQPERCILTYHSTCNAFFMDLPVSSFVSHSSLLKVKSIGVVVAHDGFLCMSVIKVATIKNTDGAACVSDHLK